MIGPYFDGGRVLDLYAGSGGLSIEAVSRGMSEAVLVERDRRAQEIVAANIAMTKEKERPTSAQLSRAVKADEISVVEPTQPLRLTLQSKNN